jgi:hypothetical protein
MGRNFHKEYKRYLIDILYDLLKEENILGNDTLYLTREIKQLEESYRFGQLDNHNLRNRVEYLCEFQTDSKFETLNIAEFIRKMKLHIIKDI